MPIQTLINAVKAWSERSFADKRAFESFRKSTEAALENVGGSGEGVRIISITAGVNSDPEWDSSADEALALIADKKPHIVSMTYTFTEGTDVVNMRPVETRIGDWYVEYVFVSEQYGYMFTFTAPTSGEIVFNSERISKRTS